MCKFHQDAATAIATDPVTGHVDPVRYAVVRTALSKFRIEQYMPALYDCGGSDPYELASEAGQRAYLASPLRARTETGDFPADLLAQARTAADKVVARHDLIDLPAKPQDFFDDAMTNFYDGYAMPNFAPQPLMLKAESHKPESTTLHAAVRDFFAQPGMDKVLPALFEYSLVRSFNEAKQSVDPVKLKAHEKKPGNLGKTLRSCAMCARDGLGGAAVSHIGCIVTPFAAGAMGLAVSGPFLAGLMLITAPVIAMGATWGLDRLRGAHTSALKLAGSAGIAVAMALAISTLTGGHDQHAGHGAGHNTSHDHSQHSAPAKPVQDHSQHHGHHNHKPAP